MPCAAMAVGFLSTSSITGSLKSQRRSECIEREGRENTSLITFLLLLHLLHSFTSFTFSFAFSIQPLLPISSLFLCLSFSPFSYFFATHFLQSPTTFRRVKGVLPGERQSQPLSFPTRVRLNRAQGNPLQVLERCWKKKEKRAGAGTKIEDIEFQNSEMK